MRDRLLQRTRVFSERHPKIAGFIGSALGVTYFIWSMALFVLAGWSLTQFFPVWSSLNDGEYYVASVALALAAWVLMNRVIIRRWWP